MTDSLFLSLPQEADLKTNLGSQTPKSSHGTHLDQTVFLPRRPGTAMGSLDFSERQEQGCGPWGDHRTASLTTASVAVSTNNKDWTDVIKDSNTTRAPPSSLSVVKEGLQSLGRRMSVSLRPKSNRRPGNTLDRHPANTPTHSPSLESMSYSPHPNAFTAPNTRALNKEKPFKWYRHNTANRPPVKRIPSLPLVEQNRQFQPPSPPASCRAPPLLPWDSHTGAAARAAAAAQNEALQCSRRPTPPLTPELGRMAELHVTTDSESGIDIDLHDPPRRFYPFDAICADPASRLPLELMEQVLSHLDSWSLVQAESVSQGWRAMAQSKYVWRDVFEREYDAAGASRHRTQSVPFPVRGVGKGTPDQDWRKLFLLRSQIDERWKKGQCAAIYLNGHTDSVYCVQFDENKIITGSRDRTIRVWDTHTLQCVKVIGPPGRTTQHPANDEWQLQPTRALHVQTMSWVEPVQQHMPEYCHTASILCLEFDEDTMVSGSSDHTAIVWSIADDYRPVFRLQGHTASVLDVCLDGRLIATCSKDRTICIWNRQSGELIKRLRGHRDPVNAMQLRGNLLASTSGDGTSKLWNISDGICVKSFPSLDRGLACVEFSEDGRTILAGGHNNIIYEYDTESGQLIRELVGHTGLIRSLHLDSRNKRIVSGSYDMAVKVWDARRGSEIGEGGLKLDFQGWTTSWMLAAKSDYRKIVCSSQDGRVVIMDFGYAIDGVELLEA